MIRRFRSKLNLSALLLIVLFTSVILSSCNQCKATEKENTDKPLALPVHVADTSDAETIKNYIGTIEGKVNVEVRPQVEGLLQEIYVDEGTFVTKGQKLFKVDASAYQEVL